MQEYKYKLGIDLGIASVGAALLGEDSIIDLYVRTFDKAEIAKTGKSLNGDRRINRLTRRTHRRRVQRLRDLRRLFHKVGLTQDEEPPITPGICTWELRAEALDRVLNSTEWATVIYHLVKHRGFQSTRKSEIDSNKDEAGKALKGCIQIQSKLDESDYRTLGELFARSDDFQTHKRNKAGSYQHSYDRSLVEREFKLLFESQRSYGNDHAESSFEKEVFEILMRRRPALSGIDVLEMFGKCTLEPEEYRSPKGSYTSERFLWTQKLNNLKVGNLGSPHSRLIDHVEDDIYLELLELPFKMKKEILYSDIRKSAKIGPEYFFIDRESRTDKGEGARIFKADGFHKLRIAYDHNKLNDQWNVDRLDPSKLDTIAYAITILKTDEEITEFLSGQNVGPEVIEAILSVSLSKTIQLSTKAIQKILPFMEARKRYDEAVKLAGYDHHSQFQRFKKGRLIPPLDKDDFKNPVVYRALNQARKLINEIVREYGPPMEIHIELARELSKSFKEREEIRSKQNDYQQAKEQDVAHFADLFNCNPSQDQLSKFRFYREQNGQCPYCCQSLDLDRAIRDYAYSQIDHIIPLSRSFDDSTSNKVLVHIKCNQDKANSIPFEYLGGGINSGDWQQFVAWVQNSSLPNSKKSKLLRESFSRELDDFLARNLSDTRYISRAFKNLIEGSLNLHPDSKAKRVLVTSGGLTAFLRWNWGITKIRENGDLHHAVDAAIIAASTHSMIQRLAEYNQKRETMVIKPEIPIPWQFFREELEARLSQDPIESLKAYPDLDKKYGDRLDSVRMVRVSRALTRRSYGPSHQETIRSMKLSEEQKSCVRTPLTELKQTDIKNIVGFDDPRNQSLIRAIEDRLTSFEGKSKDAFKEPLYKPTSDGTQGPIVRSVKVKTTQVSGLQVRGGIANNGLILRTDFFTDGKHFYVVPCYVSDAVGDLPNRAVVAHKPESEWKIMEDGKYTFMFSATKNDWIRLTTKNGDIVEGYYQGLDVNNGRISISAHDRNPEFGNNGIRRIGCWGLMNMEHFEVDILGKLHKSISKPRTLLEKKN